MIFISYSHRDSDRVHPLIERLKSEGFEVWYDKGIDPGTECDENIAMHLKQCSGIIAFLSENYIESDNCRDELNYARDLGKERLLIYLESVELPAGMAMRLNRIQAIHKYTYKNEEAFYREFTRAPMLKKSAALLKKERDADSLTGDDIRDDNMENEVFPVSKWEFIRKPENRMVYTIILICSVASMVFAPMMYYFGDLYFFPAVIILVALGLWRLNYRFVIAAAIISLLNVLIFMPIYFVLVVFLVILIYGLFKADRSYKHYLASGETTQQTGS